MYGSELTETLTQTVMLCGNHANGTEMQLQESLVMGFLNLILLPE
jgi:hypothetical protein